MYLPPIFVFHWPFSIGYPLDSQRVKESAQDRRRNFELFGSGRDSEWRNRPIWGDKKYVLPSLLPEFAGKVTLIYVDLTERTGGNGLIEPPTSDKRTSGQTA
jgi:adenine-specific DNA-methyltransferase